MARPAGGCGLGAAPPPTTPPQDPSASGLVGCSSRSEWGARVAPASVGSPAVAVVGRLVGLGFLGDGAALAALSGAALREEASVWLWRGESALPPLGSQSQPALQGAEPQVLPVHRAAAATGPSLCSVPASRAAPWQKHRQRGPLWLCEGCCRAGGGGKVGKGLEQGVCVCARGCVCVHILPEGLSPRLEGPTGEKEGAT